MRSKTVTRIALGVMIFFTCLAILPNIIGCTASSLDSTKAGVDKAAAINDQAKTLTDTIIAQKAAIDAQLATSKASVDGLKAQYESQIKVLSDQIGSIKAATTQPTANQSAVIADLTAQVKAARDQESSATAKANASLAVLAKTDTTLSTALTVAQKAESVATTSLTAAQSALSSAKSGNYAAAGSTVATTVLGFIPVTAAFAPFAGPLIGAIIAGAVGLFTTKKANAAADTAQSALTDVVHAMNTSLDSGDHAAVLDALPADTRSIVADAHDALGITPPITLDSGVPLMSSFVSSTGIGTSASSKS